TPVVTEDSRVGWVDSGVPLINSYLVPGTPAPEFVYSKIRPARSTIRTFGDSAARPEPLKRLHRKLRTILDARVGESLTSQDILDIGNLIGVCVVSGNVRRSAELALGSIDDESFLNAKNADVYPERNSYDPDNPGWGWMS